MTHQSLSPLQATRVESDLSLALLSLVLLAASALGRRLGLGESVCGLLAFFALIPAASPVFLRAWRNFFSHQLANTELLVALAVVAAFLTGSLTTAVLIPVLLTVVHFFEERSILGSRMAIEGLKTLKAKRAIKVEEGVEVSVDAESLQVGDVIVMKPGMVFPVDGIVTSGLGHVDQKSLTGESLPARVAPGSPVFAGTTNLDGRLEVRVEKTADHTSFAKILALLDEAQEVNLPELALVDRFLAFYIPFSLAAAALVGLFSQDASRAIALLVVCCPCGQLLVSSAPIIAALSEASKWGILIKTGPFLQRLTKVEGVVFDKTGTLTCGELSLVDGGALKGTLAETIAWASRATSGSLHPVARALARQCPLDAEGWQFQELPGKGCRIVKEGQEVVCGSAAWLKSLGYDLPATQPQGPENWVAKDGELLGWLRFGDQVRPEAPTAVTELRSLGLEPLTLLTGDQSEAAGLVAEACGLDGFEANLLPEEKVSHLRQMQEARPMMVVGDGVNDVPALKEAYLGVAMGAMGSDAAIEIADVALMNNDLKNLPRALRLAKETRAIIAQNIALTFAISFGLIGLSAAGVLSPLVAALSHNLGAFAVLANSGRILGCLQDRQPASMEPQEPKEESSATVQRAKKKGRGLLSPFAPLAKGLKNKK